MLLGLLSCGGQGRELSPSPPASPPRPAVTYTVAAKPSVEEVERAPLAPDAWAELAVSQAGVERAFSERYPLHGIAFHVQAQVYSAPNASGVVIGYLRRGTAFRASAGKRGEGCDQRWHELSTSGFVCAGRGFLLGENPQVFEPSPPPPALYAALPYRYAKNAAHAALQYWRVPTIEEENAAAKLVVAAPAQQLRDVVLAKPVADAEPLVLPEFVRMPMEPGFYVSVDREEPADERTFLRAVRGAYVQKSALAEVAPVRAPGVVLQGDHALPLGIVYRRAAKTYTRDAKDGQLHESEALPKFSSIALTGASDSSGKHPLRVARDGALVDDAHMRIVEHSARPALVPKHARFIHIDLTQQTLVAYDGQEPVFATLVSTGKPGYETPQGIFRIQEKHVSATMDGLAGSDEAYSIEDVPWTMYFQGSYALHAAFWHEHFGNVRSHGCVNLAPQDARWLFRWVTPTLPAGYHGIIAQPHDPGTWVSITP